MIKEKLKRIPIISFILHLLHPNYSRCNICGLPWSNCKSHTIYMKEYEGFFHVCEYCWEHHSIERLQKACVPLHESWLKFGVEPYTVKQMQDKVKELKQKEYNDALYNTMKEFFESKSE